MISINRPSLVLFHILKEALHHIRRYPMRSFLTMLGVVNGIVALVLSVAMSHATRKEIATQLEALGTRLLVIRPFFSYDASGLIPNQIRYTLDDITRIKKAALSVDEATPSFHNRFPFQYRRRFPQIEVIGTDDKYAYVKNLQVRQGRFLSAIDLIGNPYVAVLNKTAAKELGVQDDPPTDIELRVGGLAANVVGIVEDKTTEMGPGAAIAYLPLTFYHQLSGDGDDSAFNIYALVKETFTVDEGINEIKLLLKAMYGPFAEETVSSTSDFLQVTNAIQERALSVLGVMTGITLLLGGMGITYFLILSVKERTSEIGIRKAVGAKDSTILLQFIAEGFLLSVAGGIMGVLLGIYAVKMVLPALNLAVVVPHSALWVSLVFSVGLGIMGSVYPAFVAMRLTPIDALRYE